MAALVERAPAHHNIMAAQDPAGLGSVVACGRATEAHIRLPFSTCPTVPMQCQPSGELAAGGG